MQDVDELDARDYIVIKGAKMHNLKDVDVAIKRNSFTVVTGLSGSGKSSLAFDTLYAEGQRRYIESLSAYARQFLGKIEKPKVDYIRGISPAVAIEQKVNTRNPRSTVGTTTEIYDYLKLLFARIGRTISPISGKEVKKHNTTDVIDYIFSLPEGSRWMVTTNIEYSDKTDLKKRLQLLEKNGFTRIMVDSKVERIAKLDDVAGEDFQLVVDRFEVKPEEEGFRNRLADSIDLGFYEGHGRIAIRDFADPQNAMSFSSLFEMDGMRFEEPDIHFLSFNNPRGACKKCEGFGSIIGIDEDLVIPDTSLSVFEDAIVCWKGEKMSAWKNKLIQSATKFDFPIHRAVQDLTREQKVLLWKGNEHFEGLDAFFEHLEEKSYKIQYRVMLSRYRGKTRCPECRGRACARMRTMLRSMGFQYPI